MTWTWDLWSEKSDRTWLGGAETSDLSPHLVTHTQKQEPRWFSLTPKFLFLPADPSKPNVSTQDLWAANLQSRRSKSVKVRRGHYHNGTITFITWDRSWSISWPTFTGPDSKLAFIPLISMTAFTVVHLYSLQGQRSSQVTRHAQPMLLCTHLIINYGIFNKAVSNGFIFDISIGLFRSLGPFCILIFNNCDAPSFTRGQTCVVWQTDAVLFRQNSDGRPSRPWLQRLLWQRPICKRSARRRFKVHFI